MSAELIARHLGGRRSGKYWMACCPAHPDANPSLSICDAPGGKVLVRCFAGCGQHAVISELRQRGLWGRIYCDQNVEPTRAPTTNPEPSFGMAMDIWSRSYQSDATLVEVYLHSRGLVLPLVADLRFHPKLRHQSGTVHPAMVALVRNGVTGTAIAIHRTFLAGDGIGKAPVDPAKMMLGPCRGGIVRLGEPRDMLMVGEGIETCLAAMQATGKPAWAALSTSGLRSLELPHAVSNVIVLADGDEPGEAAAQSCAQRWQREGRRVRIARPPAGMDFNDLLKTQDPALMEREQ